MRVDVLEWIKDKIRRRYLGRRMDYLADTIAKLSHGRKNWYVDRESIPVDDSSGGKCEHVIKSGPRSPGLEKRPNLPDQGVPGRNCFWSK